MGFAGGLNCVIGHKVRELGMEIIIHIQQWGVAHGMKFIKYHQNFYINYRHFIYSQLISLTSRVITFTKITRVVPRLTIIHNLCLIFRYDNCYTIYSDFTRLSRGAVNVFQSHIFGSFVFIARNFIGRFWRVRITRAGKLDLAGSLLSNESWIESRLSCWCA